MEKCLMKGHTYISNPVDKNGFVKWNQQENNTWANLVERQQKIIVGRACKEFLSGVDILGFPSDAVPQLPEINSILDAHSGWGVEPVPALIQPAEFFKLLANRRFPAATFIRTPAELDYIQEPDIFHEIYGHTPLLTNLAYGNFMQAFGELALSAEPKMRRRLFRLFWFTVEFGLLKTDDGLRAYGGGILSSIGETEYCLTEKSIKEPFDILTVLRTPYRIDIMQPLYYVLNEFEDLFKILDSDILKILDEATAMGDLPPLFEPEEKNSADKDGAMKC